MACATHGLEEGKRCGVVYTPIVFLFPKKKRKNAGFAGLYPTGGSDSYKKSKNSTQGRQEANREASPKNINSRIDHMQTRKPAIGSPSGFTRRVIFGQTREPLWRPM
jgi:hypothetical protein